MRWDKNSGPIRGFLWPALAWLTMGPAAWGQSALTTLHSFTAAEGTDANGALIEGTDGRFYGTTSQGVNGGAAGSVFQITADGQFITLHSFDTTGAANPMGSLILGSDGYLYGTTYNGGTNGCGTIFRLAPAPDDSYFVVHNFTGGDGSNPDGGLIQTADGNFHGTTFFGGTSNKGTIFTLTPDGALTTNYYFRGTLDDSLNPRGSLLADDNGNLYGTTIGRVFIFNGNYQAGTVFRFTPDGVLTVLHSFGDNPGEGENTYVDPGVIRGLDGNFYGTAAYDDHRFIYAFDEVFQITLDGEFTSAGDYHSTLMSSVVQGRDGDFYGTTAQGGDHDLGSIFRVTPTGRFTTLYSFGGPDGSAPVARLVQGDDGAFYGTTTRGGTNGGYGTVFRLAASPAFFDGEAVVGNGVYYLAFANGNPFGYYSYLSDPHYLYHFDLGYEYVFNAQDGKAGVYLYDFASDTFFYTSPTYPFPYLYDLTLDTVLYYYPDPDNPGHYNTGGTRFFYRFDTGETIVK